MKLWEHSVVRVFNPCTWEAEQKDLCYFRANLVYTVSEILCQKK